MCAVQTTPTLGTLPPADLKFEDSEDAQEFQIVKKILPTGATFEKGQHIAKACSNKDNSWEYYVGTVTKLTKAGPWVKFIDCENKQARVHAA